mmetsp:Transcript_23035/g.37003  ORF Transcript_23035/g.37003 Transcript_23035/m.37003 type:complete len:120 (-) Transcript_23035:140-499(-)
MTHYSSLYIIFLYHSPCRANIDLQSTTFSYAVVIFIILRNKIMYAMGDDQVLYCFNCEDGSVQDAVRLHAKEVIGITHHPHRNILASFSTDGTMKIWRSGAKTKKVGPRFTDTTTAESK